MEKKLVHLKEQIRKSGKQYYTACLTAERTRQDWENTSIKVSCCSASTWLHLTSWQCRCQFRCVAIHQWWRTASSQHTPQNLFLFWARIDMWGTHTITTGILILNPPPCSNHWPMTLLKAWVHSYTHRHIICLVMFMYYMSMVPRITVIPYQNMCKELFLESPSCLVVRARKMPWLTWSLRMYWMSRNHGPHALSGLLNWRKEGEC